MAKKRKFKSSDSEKPLGTETTRFWQATWFPAAVFLLVSLIYFSEFAFSEKVIYGSDIGADFHKGKEGFIEKLAKIPQPMWHQQMGGFPQSDEIRPQYFPSHLIYLFTTYQRHVGWRYILTVFLAGCGIYLYLRGVGVGRWAAIWCGIAYMSAPTFLSFTYAGHYAKMAVIALFPFMCHFLEQGMSSGRARHFLALGIMIALGIYSPHTQMVFYALCALGLYFLFRAGLRYRHEGTWKPILQRTGLFVVAVAVGLGLGAEGFLPSYLHAKQESKRAAASEGLARSAEQQLAFARSWSLHPEEVGSLVVPEFGGFFDPNSRSNYYWGRNYAKLNSEYFGVLVLILALAMGPSLRRNPLAAFMAGLLLLVLAFALGEHTPVHWLAFHLVPGFDVLRTIGMSAFLCAFAACVLAALALDRVLKDIPEPETLKHVLVAGSSISALALLLSVAPEDMTGLWTSIVYPSIAADKQQVLRQSYDWLARGALAVTLIAGCGTALLYLRSRQVIGIALLIVVLSGLAIFDGWRISRIFLKYEDPRRYADIRTENRELRAVLDRHSDPYRILPLPDYDLLSQPGFGLHEVNMVTGFHNFTLQRYDQLLRYFVPTTDLFRRKYYRGQSVPYSNEDLINALQPLLNLTNVRYIVCRRDISISSGKYPEIYADRKFKVYENPAALPWFYTVPAYRVETEGHRIVEQLVRGSVDPRREVILEQEVPLFDQGLAADTAADQIRTLEYDPQGGRITLEVACPGPRMLVISDNFHPNWRAHVDGEQVPLLRANFVWKAIHVPAGNHTVQLTYRSNVLVLSRILSAATLLLLAGFGVLEIRRHQRSQDLAMVA
jgi:hypothetical protein